MSFSVIQKPIIVLPTYNEILNIERMLRALRAASPAAHILVVDDSSPDGTAAVVNSLMESLGQIHLLSRTAKNGLGKAYLAGFAWALERGYDAIVQMDADFSHPPQDVARLLAKLAEADVAVGCRYMPGGATPGWSWTRRGISQGGNWYARLVLSLPYRDLTGGFNAWRRSVLESVALAEVESRGYAFQVELKYRAHKKGFRLAEIPIVFAERAAGESKMSADIVREAALRVPKLRCLVS